MAPLNRITALAFLLTSICFTSVISAARTPKDAVLLSSVKTLTFKKDKMTTHRRVSAIPQMSCSGGSARGLFEPETMRCTNMGSSYSSAEVEWTCTASLPPEFKLGTTDVVCEGYSNAEDEYVLKGSCGVEYRLVLTDKGEEVYGKSGSWKNWFGESGTKQNQDNTDNATNYLFWLLFIAVAGWILYSIFLRNHNAQARVGRRPGGRNTGFFRGGGGGGGDDDDGGDDPPPPYTPHTPRSSGPRKPTASSSTYTSSNPSAAGSSNQGAWRPGFFSGAAAGAAATYLAGQGRRQQPPPAPTGGGWFGGTNRNTGNIYGSSSWGGGGGWGGGSRHDPGEGSSRQSNGPSYSSERQTSSGFGSTRRR